MLNLNLLRTFATVAEEGTLSAAAEKLHLRQPTISLHIQNLEDSIGAKILVRRGKGMDLTPEGRIVLAKAREVIAYCKKTETEMFDSLQRAKLQIRVGGGPIMADHVLPHVVALFQQSHPAMEVAIEPAETAFILKGVLDRTYDIGFVGFPLKNDRLELEEWIEEELFLIMPPNHSFVGRQSVEPGELKGQTFIWHKAATGIRMFVEETLAAVGLDLGSEIGNCGEASSTMSLLSSVNAGLGIAFAPRYSAQNAIRMGMVSSVRITGVPMLRKLYIATLKQHLKPAVVDEFIDAAKSYGYSMSAA